MLKESKADIFVDPVLHTACALDIKHQCAAIPPGKGRRESSHKHQPRRSATVFRESRNVLDGSSGFKKVLCNLAVFVQLPPQRISDFMCFEDAPQRNVFTY